MTYYFKTVLLAAIFFALVSIAFSQEKKGKLLGSVRVEGNKTISEEPIRLHSELIPALLKEVYAEDFAKAVRNLWELNSFSDIQIYIENPNDRIINVIIKVEEYPSLKSLQFQGNIKIDTDKLTSTTNLYPSQKISPSIINTSINRIKALYKEKGYHLADVKVDTAKADEEGKINITFSIDEGEKIKIKNINFVGNEIFAEGKLRKQMKKTKQAGFFRGGDFKQEQYKEDRDNVINFYRKEGYRDVRILSDSIYYSSDKKYMNLLIRVEEGEKYYINDVAYEGNKKIKTEDLIKVLDMAGFNIKKGDVYNSERIGKALFIIQQEYSNIGYLKAGIEAPERPVGIDSVNIQFNIVEDIPVTVNRIDIKGNTKTKEKVIRRELQIKPGDIFNYAKLNRSFRDISILNYFSNIDTKYEFIDVEKTALDLTITVEEKSTDTANMSAGFSQRDGMIGALGLSMNNLMGNGQQLYIDWQFGRIYRSFQIGFTEPWLFDTPTSGGFSIFDVHRGGEFYGYEQDSKGITFRVGRRLKWPDDYFRGDWYFEYSNNRYSNVQNGLNLGQYLIREKTTQVSITQIIMRSSQGNEKNPAIAAEFPSNGSTVSFSSQYSGGILTGTENFIKFTLNTDWYTPALYHFVLYQNVLMGLIKNLDPKYNLSPQELFFLGGSALTIGTALRGYDDRMVGPLSEDNSWPLGGQALLKATTELRFNISRNPTIYGLFFAEAGNNWLNISYTNPFDLKRSTGAGLRFFMPMLGMVGFDIAYGFDNYTSPGKRRGWMPHFQFGRGF